MSNRWKGLLLGALAGLALGAVLDSRQARSRRAGDAPARLKEAVAQSTAALQDADLPAKARHVAQRLGEVEVPDQAKQVVDKVVAKGKDLASSVQQADVATQGRAVARAAATKAREAGHLA